MTVQESLKRSFTCLRCKVEVKVWLHLNTQLTEPLVCPLCGALKLSLLKKNLEGLKQELKTIVIDEHNLGETPWDDEWDVCQYVNDGLWTFDDLEDVMEDTNK